MKTKLLKKIRQNVRHRYEIRRGEHHHKMVWRIYTGPRIFLEGEYDTKEEALAAFQKVFQEAWHRDCEDYLWFNRDRRKHKIPRKTPPS